MEEILFFQGQSFSRLKEVDENVPEFISDANLVKYPSKFINMWQNINTVEGEIDDEVVCGLFGALVSKLANARINESLSAKIDRLDYQPLFEKGARAPSPNSRLDAWGFFC